MSFIILCLSLGLIKAMFSKTCEYAMRAMIFIAQSSLKEKRVGVKAIADGIASPEHFIAKILQELVKKNLLQSLKGPNGGFYLDAKLSKASLADIVMAVDGDNFFSRCGLGLKQCSEVKPCPLHNEFKKVRQDTLKMLENARLDVLVEEMNINGLFLKRQ